MRGREGGQRAEAGEEDTAVPRDVVDKHKDGEKGLAVKQKEG